MSEGLSIKDMQDDPFMTVSEVAELARLSRMTVYREITANRLKASKIGRAFRIRQSAVREWLDNAAEKTN